MLPMPTVLRNFSWLLLANIFNKLCSLGVMVLTVRMLGAEGFGLFSWILSLYWVLLLLADFGTNESLLRECSSKRLSLQEGYALFLPLKLLLLFSASLIAGITAFATAFDKPSELLLFLPLGMLIFIDSFGGFLKIAFRVEEKMEKEAFLFAAEGFLKLLFIAALWGYGLSFPVSPLLPASLLMFATAIVTIAGWVLSRRITGSFRLRWEKEKLLHLLKLSAPLAFLYTLSLLNFRLDTLMLPIGVNDNVIGAYSAAWRLLEQSFLLPVLLSTALFPTVTRLKEEKEEDLQGLFSKTVGSLIFSGFLFTFLFFFSASFLLPFLYGEEFLLSAHFFALLSFTLIPFYFKLGVDKICIAYQAQKWLLLIFTGTVFLNLCLNLKLIPAYGADGAAWATLISEWCGMLVLFYTFRKVSG